jgi:hypothetical protein
MFFLYIGSPGFLFNPIRYQIRAGDVDLQSSRGDQTRVQVRNVSCGIIHPHRQFLASALYNDVVVLRLDEPLQVSLFYPSVSKSLAIFICNSN